MTIDAELLELLESTVTIAPAETARGLDGKRTFATAASYAAHIEPRRDLIRNASGEEVLTSGFCHLDGYYPEVKETSRLTLPGGATPTILAVTHTYDSSGPYQTVIAW